MSDYMTSLLEKALYVSVALVTVMCLTLITLAVQDLFVHIFMGG